MLKKCNKTTKQLQARLHEVQGEVTSVSQRLNVHEVEEDDEDELTDKLDELKNEFTQLLSEVRRRRSLLGDPGASPIFETLGSLAGRSTGCPFPPRVLGVSR
ncbi:hypothetical protein B566_EDAN001471 [Ephemera danica]|nr:hypothetical protein B566_EDAN001471 [Ephemera danica]